MEENYKIDSQGVKLKVDGKYYVKNSNYRFLERIEPNKYVSVNYPTGNYNCQYVKYDSLEEAQTVADYYNKIMEINQRDVKLSPQPFYVDDNCGIAENSYTIKSMDELSTTYRIYDKRVEPKYNNSLWIRYLGHIQTWLSRCCDTNAPLYLSKDDAEEVANYLNLIEDINEKYYKEGNLNYEHIGKGPHFYVSSI